MDTQEIFMAAFVDELEKLGVWGALASGAAQVGGSLLAEKAVTTLKPKKQPQPATKPLRS